MSDDTPQLDIDWLKTIGGALAAVSTAVLLSTLGAAGTLIGAAVGSVAVTVTTQLYTQGLARSRQTMAKAQEAALTKVGIAQVEVRRAGRRQGDDDAIEAHLAHADESLVQARTELRETGSATPTWRHRVGMLPWKRIVLLAAATFVVVLVAIGGFERIAGRSVASYTGGADRESGSIVPGGSSNTNQDRAPAEERDDTPKPNDDASPRDDASPSETPSTDAPTQTETPTPSPTPTPSTTTVPTPAPTPAPTSSRVPVPSPTR
ncbi:MAG: hypothetical protein LH468_10515 [Nocardioides sp.]|nr:hypothetical protein [Nocardioides sp.]